VPGLRTPKISKQINEIQKINKRVKDITIMFSHFTRYPWVFKSNKIYEFYEKMTPEERSTFYMDPKEFNWERYLY
jgi:hypothetical protein